MVLDVEKLIKDIKDATSAILQKDVTAAKGFAERQVVAIAEIASTVAAGILDGAIREENQKFFLDQLVAMSKNFAATLVGLTAVTIEKVWNKVVSIVWDVISKAIGAALPVPA